LRASRPLAEKRAAQALGERSDPPIRAMQEASLRCDGALASESSELSRGWLAVAISMPAGRGEFTQRLQLDRYSPLHQVGHAKLAVRCYVNTAVRDGSRTVNRFQSLGTCRLIGPQQLQEPNMRTLLAFAIVTSGVFALSQAADAARKYKRSAEPSYSYGYGAYQRYSREQVECERARHEDPAGVYAGYPCWAREAFSAGSNRGGTRR
jgi:hypothetical protein